MKKVELKKLTPEELLAQALIQADRIDELEKSLKEKQAELDEAATEYAKLSKRLDQAESGKGPKTFGEVKVGKTTYDIVRPKTNYKGQIITAKQLEADAELAAQLVKIGAGILREQTKE